MAQEERKIKDGPCPKVCSAPQLQESLGPEDSKLLHTRTFQTACQCAWPGKETEEPENSEHLGAQQIVETQNNISPVMQRETFKAIDAEVDAEAHVDCAKNDVTSPLPQIAVKEPVAATEHLGTAPSESSIPAGQPDWMGPGERAEGTQGIPNLNIVHASQPLDEGFRAGLCLLHTSELRRACLERGLVSSGSKRELLNSLLSFFSGQPPPTPTQDVSSPKQGHVESSKPAEPVPAAHSSACGPAIHDNPGAPVCPVASGGLVAQEGEAVPACRGERKEPLRATSAPLQVKASDAPPAALVAEIEQLRPLKPIQRRPLAQTSLLRRGRDPAPAAAPNFTSLWQTMVKPRQQRTADLERDVEGS